MTSTPESALTDRRLIAANHSLNLGSKVQARQLVLDCLARARATKDSNVEAQAYLVMGQIFVSESRMRIAREMGTRADKLFLAEANLVGRADALALVSYTASNLGFDAEAVQAAKDGILLREKLADPLVRASGFNYLGVASFWSRDFTTAAEVLYASIRFATGESANDGAVFHPMANACFAEALKIWELHRTQGADVSLARLSRLTAQCRELTRVGKVLTFNTGTVPIGLLLLDFSCLILACKQGQREKAAGYYAACLDRVSTFPASSWVRALVNWAKVEVARVYGYRSQSIAAAFEMVTSARDGQHRQLQTMAEFMSAELILDRPGHSIH